ncbi:MAG TPA: AAA family ATPase, partial [Acidimicrobiia bacterium]|nr:AAA family ATPase [Acidimicrobiia bacterium]
QGIERRPLPIVSGSAAIEDLPEPEWLVEGVLPDGALHLLYGAPGIGKSFLALDISAAVATGNPWHGRSVKKGSVVQVVAEGAADLPIRIRAWRTQAGVDSVDDLHVVLGPVNLYSDHGAEQLGYQLDLLGISPALIVFDTLARCMAGGDENSAKDMGLVVAHSDALRSQYGCAVLAVHHAGKDARTERGSSALKGAVDTQLRLDGKQGTKTLKCEKQKTAAPFADIPLALVGEFQRSVHGPVMMTGANP